MATFTMTVATAAANPLQERIDTTKSYQLQNVQVVSTRATRKTPVAFSDLSKRQLKTLNYGKDLPSLLNFTPSVTMSSDAGT